LRPNHSLRPADGREIIATPEAAPGTQRRMKR
jgi:hypothetical protein